jgi:hypothetical protein
MIIVNWKPGAQVALPRIRVPIVDQRPCRHVWEKLEWGGEAYLGGWRYICRKCGSFIR